MAGTTDPALQRAVVYSVFVRNHTAQGTFAALANDLERIRQLGVDVIWLLPIHPVGKKCRKGTLGSPYAIRDYRSVNPSYGTHQEFVALVDAIHEQGMRCMIDVVYNHTSPDSVLFKEHPEYFWKNADGCAGHRVESWTDIIDLDYTARGLWEYQIQTLCDWARVVDGFRCDVAPLVPIEFWRRARATVARINTKLVWLAETTHRSYGEEFRRRGMYCARDAELYDVFDMEYAYDVQETFEDWLEGRTPLSHYVDFLEFEDCVYPSNYNKLRFLENHDQPRIASRVADVRSLRNLTAFLYFQKGATLLYAGQEKAVTHAPSLFERNPVDWTGTTDLSGLMRTLARIKRTFLEEDDVFWARADDERDIAVVYRDGKEARRVGVFSLRAQESRVEVRIADGVYRNLIDGSAVEVQNGTLACTGEPIIL